MVEDVSSSSTTDVSKPPVDDDYLMSVVSDTMTLDVLNALTQEA